MIKIENFEVVGIEHAIRGMRNPMNSWEKSDSHFNLRCDDMDCDLCPGHGHDNCVERLNVCSCDIGPNDLTLMKKLAAGGPVHAKYRRMIAVYLDITAPLYWWKEFDTYKVGTVANSCSTMHKIHDKEFTREDFSWDQLIDTEPIPTRAYSPLGMLDATIENLNILRRLFLETGDKKYWWQMIQLLPSSYNQKRTIMLNYEVLTGIYQSRKNHKLDEWRTLCEWIEQLPYSEIITGPREEE